MQRVGGPLVGDGPARGDQRLRRDLPAEDPGHHRAAARAPEDVLLDPLQVEQIEQGIECCAHEENVVQLAESAYRPMSLAMIIFMTSLVPP